MINMAWMTLEVGKAQPHLPGIFRQPDVSEQDHNATEERKEHANRANSDKRILSPNGVHLYFCSCNHRS